MGVQDDVEALDATLPRGQSRWITTLILLVYVLLALVMTWPVISKLGTELAGSHSDLWIHQWTFWWIKEAILNGQSPFYTTLLYYPSGVSLTSHNIAWFNIALWLPLQAIAGSIAAYNLIFISVYALNGFTFYLFADELSASRAASFIGGLVFGFWPYTLSHNDHPNMVVLFWVPLTMFFLHRAYRQQKLRYALLAGVSLAMIGITRWQLLVMSSPILLAYVLYLFVSEKDGRTRRTIGLFLLAGVLALCLMAPLAAPVVKDQLSRSDTVGVTVYEKEGVTDLLAYVVPPAIYNQFWRDEPFPVWFLEPYENIAASVHYIPFIGYLTIVLALYGAIIAWRKSWFWSLLALAAMLMAMGSTLTIDGQPFVQLPMPYRLLGDSLIATLIRRPHRLNLFLSLPVAMLVTWAVDDILRRIDRRAWRHGKFVAALTVIAIGLIILWENPVAPPFPTTSTEIPQWYQQLADDPDVFGILELPTYERGFDKLYMFYQIQHGKPISGGHVSRLPVGADAFRESVPFLQPLLRQDSWLVQPEDWVDFANVDVTRQFRQLAAANVRYVVVNKTLLNEGILGRWLDWVTLEPIYEDEILLVYSTDPQEGREFAVDKLLTVDIGVSSTMVSPQEANQAGTLFVDLRWGTVAAPDKSYQACFSLRDAQDESTPLQCAQPAPGWPTSQWQANEMVRGSYTLPIAADLTPGDYSLELFLVEDGQQASAGETAVLGDIHIHPFQAENRTPACWENQICLVGYDMEQTADTVELTHFWQAPDPLDTSYKLFVHLVDAENEDVVAQSDAVPRGWTYPTDIWQPGEIVRDTISLPIKQIAPGEYQIWLGWYEADSGERLTVCPMGGCDGQTAETFKLDTIQVTAEES
jgi:hypothetical protein